MCTVLDSFLEMTEIKKVIKRRNEDYKILSTDIANIVYEKFSFLFHTYYTSSDHFGNTDYMSLRINITKCKIRNTFDFYVNTKDKSQSYMHYFNSVDRELNTKEEVNGSDIFYALMLIVESEIRDLEREETRLFNKSYLLQNILHGLQRLLK